MKTKNIILITFILFINQTLFSQQKKVDWDKWNWLIGEWIGEGNGQPGQGEGTFSFQLDLDKNILVRKAHSEYPATKNKPSIIHDDLMVIYCDSAGIPDKAIYFDNENHVLNYNITILDKSVVFLSEKIPDTAVFRLTYIFIDSDHVNIKFEMSLDGEKFYTYIEGKSKKKK